MCLVSTSTTSAVSVRFFSFFSFSLTIYALFVSLLIRLIRSVFYFIFGSILRRVRLNWPCDSYYRTLTTLVCTASGYSSTFYRQSIPTSNIESHSKKIRVSRVTKNRRKNYFISIRSRRSRRSRRTTTLPTEIRFVLLCYKRGSSGVFTTYFFCGGGEKCKTTNTS